MQLWDVVKGKGLNTTYNLCGYPVYKIIEKQNLRERKFCQGLLSSKKITDYSKGIHLREFFICGLRISQRGIDNYKLIFKVFGIALRNEDVLRAFYKKYKSKVPADTDFICFLSTGIGEFSLFLSLCLKDFLKQNNIKHPLFITQTKSHRALLDIFSSASNFLDIRNLSFQRFGEFNIENIKAIYLFPTIYFQQVEEDIKNKKVHFFEQILKYLKLKQDNFSVNLPKIADKYKNTAEEKLKSLGLTNKKFIFIAPDANSCEAVDKQFWNQLARNLQNKGFEIIFNSTELPLPAKCLMTDFSLQEAFVIAKKAQAVIGLRSGLLDLLSMTGTPIHAIYTDFKERTNFPPMSKEDVKIGFDLEKIPEDIRKSKIYSYFYSDILVDNILGKI